LEGKPLAWRKGITEKRREGERKKEVQDAVSKKAD